MFGMFKKKSDSRETTSVSDYESDISHTAATFLSLLRNDNKQSMVAVAIVSIIHWYTTLNEQNKQTQFKNALCSINDPLAPKDLVQLDTILQTSKDIIKKYNHLKNKIKPFKNSLATWAKHTAKAMEVVNGFILTVINNLPNDITETEFNNQVMTFITLTTEQKIIYLAQLKNIPLNPNHNKFSSYKTLHQTLIKNRLDLLNRGADTTSLNWLSQTFHDLSIRPLLTPPIINKYLRPLENS